MRHAFLVPLVLAATALPAEAAFQSAGECVRIVTLEDGARLRLGFNVFPPGPPARERGESFSLWADGRQLPDPPGAFSHSLRMDLEVPNMRESESDELDYDLLLAALRSGQSLEIGSDPVIAVPIGDAARIAREAERCMASPGLRPRRCRHVVRLADGASVAFHFRHHRPYVHMTPAAAPPAPLVVSAGGSAIPLAGPRRATIRASWPVVTRSPYVYVHLDPFVAALRANSRFELRDPRGRAFRTATIPDAGQLARQAQWCMALRDTGRR